MSIKFLVLGGVFWVFWFFLGGVCADFIFMGARIFLIVADRFILTKEVQGWGWGSKFDPHSKE